MAIVIVATTSKLIVINWLPTLPIDNQLPNAGNVLEIIFPKTENSPILMPKIQSWNLLKISNPNNEFHGVKPKIKNKITTLNTVIKGHTLIFL